MGQVVGLLVWDLLGSVLANITWIDLATVLTGGEVISNMFTMTLLWYILQSQLLHTHLEVVLRNASSAYVAAEALLADWVDKMAVGRRVDAHTSQVLWDCCRTPMV